MASRKFDLNIEKVLQDWELPHAVREVIANALDERALTATKSPEIYCETEVWHVRDFGRGLKYEHLTQNEDAEKLSNPAKVVGKFGVGLKDALATFHRRGDEVTIRSRHCTLTFDMTAKHGFEDVLTLHAFVSSPENPEMVGTDVVLRGVSEDDILVAKSFFLTYSGDEGLAHTKYGDILERSGKTGRIYITGLRVAEEGNFLLSYNITSMTAGIRKALNRERTNVGRAAYSGRVQDILLAQTSPEVSRRLVEDLQNFKTGKMHDELQWALTFIGGGAVTLGAVLAAVRLKLHGTAGLRC